MNERTVQLPQLAWFGNPQFEIDIPASWELTVCRMRGHSAPALTESEIREALAKPIGCPPIRELARGKEEVVILFDDMSRPTRVAGIVPAVLEELAAAGVKDSSIRFIAAIGAHGALTRVDFAKKLGEDVLQRFPVYNHNPYENCTPLGTTSAGTPLAVNSEFMKCDLKIGIGSILPHPLTGFSGGGKIVLPGVASIETIIANHGVLTAQALASGRPDTSGVGTFEENFLRKDVAEAARMAGLDFKVDAVVNINGETAALFAGEPGLMHVEAVKKARDAYATELIEAPDIAILNAYAKANESPLALPLAGDLFKNRSGDLVLIANAPDGQVTHYVARSFGKTTGGRLFWARPLTPNVNRMFFLNYYTDLAGVDWLGPPGSITLARTWSEVRDRLLEIHGAGAKVAVIPDATMQYLVPAS